MCKVELNECVGCGQEFSTLPTEDSMVPMYCTPECEKHHSIFEEK